MPNTKDIPAVSAEEHVDGISVDTYITGEPGKTCKCGQITYYTRKAAHDRFEFRTLSGVAHPLHAPLEAGFVAKERDSGELITKVSVRFPDNAPAALIKVLGVKVLVTNGLCDSE